MEKIGDLSMVVAGEGSDLKVGALNYCAAVSVCH